MPANKYICVHKKATKETGFSYHGYVESPNEVWLREENITNYTKREEAEALSLAHLLLKTGRITKIDFKKAKERYAQEQRDDLTFLREHQF